LLESPQVLWAGTVAANGGGGGVCTPPKSRNTRTPLLRQAVVELLRGPGGNGSAGTTVDGAAADKAYSNGWTVATMAAAAAGQVAFDKHIFRSGYNYRNTFSSDQHNLCVTRQTKDELMDTTVPETHSAGATIF